MKPETSAAPEEHKEKKKRGRISSKSFRKVFKIFAGKKKSAKHDGKYDVFIVDVLSFAAD